MDSLTASNAKDAPAIVRATVTAVLSDTPSGLDGNGRENYEELAVAKIISGPERGTAIDVSASYTEGDGTRIAPGQVIYVTDAIEGGGGNPTAPAYQAIDHFRIPGLIWFLFMFIACVVLIGGKQGMRGIIALIGGVALIFFLLVPGVLHGYSPILLSIVVASLIASIGAYITHGVSRMTTSAVIGMIISIIAAVLLADAAVHLCYLSGVTDENTANLLADPGYDAVNFQGLLLGGIIIGLLGVLYDAAIGQAVAIEELRIAAGRLSRRAAFSHAMRIGREHIGALVNTLVLAYVGTSLPLFISYYGSSLFTSAYFSPIVNQDWFVTEVIRMTAGGIGLMLAIPITSVVAVWMLLPNGSSNAGQ